MKVVPQLLFQHPKVKKIMADGLSCIIYKSIDTIDTNTDHFVAAHVFSVVLKGALKLETFYEGERFLATQNQVIFIPKGRYMISDIIPENGEFEAVFFFFEEELVHNVLKSMTSAQTNVPGEPNNFIFSYTEQIRYFTESLLKLYPDGNGQNRAVTQLKLLELLHLIYNSDERHQLVQLLSTLSNKKKRNLKELMLLNYDKPLTIEDYAFLAGRSLSTFRRDFKRQFDMSPKNWLINMRLEKAEKLLLKANNSIQQVSIEIGYDNPSHFITAFSKRFGITPKQFLIKHRMNSTFAAPF